MPQFGQRSVFDNVLEDKLKSVNHALGHALPNAYNEVLSLENFVYPYLLEDKQYKNKREQLNNDYENKKKELENTKGRYLEKVENTKRATQEHANAIYQLINVTLKNQNLHPASQDYEDDMK